MILIDFAVKAFRGLVNNRRRTGEGPTSLSQLANADALEFQSRAVADPEIELYALHSIGGHRCNPEHLSKGSIEIVDQAIEDATILKAMLTATPLTGISGDVGAEEILYAVRGNECFNHNNPSVICDIVVSYLERLQDVVF